MNNQTVPIVSVIIVTYNKRRLLLDCLESLVLCDYPQLEIIVVDNGRGDLSNTDIKKFKRPNVTDLKLIALGYNSGFAKANNIGASFSSGKYLFLLNNDTLVDKDCIKKLVTIMEHDQTVGIIQPKLILSEKTQVIDSLGYIIDRTGWGFSIGRNRVYEKSFDNLFSISYGKGAALLVRKSVTDKTGLFDEDFFFLSEDLDLSWKVWLNGYRVICFSKSTVIHRVSSSMSLISCQTRSFHQTKNLVATMIKNYQIDNVFFYIIPVLITNFVYYLSFPKMRRSEALKGFFKGVVWISRNLRVIIRKRYIVQKDIRRLSDKKALQKMMSTFPLFIKKVNAQAG